MPPFLTGSAGGRGGPSTVPMPIYPQQYNAASTGSFAGSGAVQGQVSLGVIGLAIVGLIGFYLWTHNVQGGG